MDATRTRHPFKAAVAIAIAAALASAPLGAAEAAQLQPATPEAAQTQAAQVAAQAKRHVAAKDIKVSKIATQKWTGKAAIVRPTVKVNGKKLACGRDYTLSYKNHKKPGTAKVTIKLKGKYSGSKTVKYKVYSKNGKKYTWVKEKVKKYKTEKLIESVDTSAWDRALAEKFDGKNPNNPGHTLINPRLYCARCGEKFTSDDAVNEFIKHTWTHAAREWGEDGLPVDFDCKKASYLVCGERVKRVCTECGAEFEGTPDEKSAAWLAHIKETYDRVGSWACVGYSSVTYSVEYRPDKSKTTYKTVKTPYYQTRWVQKWV